MADTKDGHPMPDRSSPHPPRIAHLDHFEVTLYAPGPFDGGAWTLACQSLQAGVHLVVTLQPDELQLLATLLADAAI